MTTIATRTKRADEGDGQDATFEQNFSDLVHLVLKDRAPALLDYELGFQLLDRDTDDNKAVGVCVFRVGPHDLYVPAFFVGGKIKGTELLYCKQQDLFLPLQEDWVHYLLNKQPGRLGNRASRNLAELGVSSPDMRQLNRPPTKFASVDYMATVMPRWAKVLTTSPLHDWPVSLPEFLKDAGAPALVALQGMLVHCPALARDLANFHGDGLLAAMKAAAAKSPVPVAVVSSEVSDSVLDDDHPLKTGELKVTVYDRAGDGDDASLLGAAPSKIEGVPDRLSVEDERSDRRVSTPYHTTTKRALTNPTETGLYDVLARPLKYEKCLVVMQPLTAHGRQQFCTVVCLEDKRFVNVHPSLVWAGKQYSADEFNTWLDGLPAADSLPVRKRPAEPSTSSAYTESPGYRVILDRRGNGTAPVQADYVMGSSDGGDVYHAQFCTHRDDYDVASIETAMGLHCDYGIGTRYDGHVNLGGGRGTKLWCAGQSLFTPDDAKSLEATKARHDEPVLQLGQPIDVQLDLVQKTAPFSAQVKAGRYLLDGREFPAVAEAAAHLVAGHGLRLEAALAILEKAAALEYKRDPVFRCRIKHAEPFLSDRQVSAPPLPEPMITREQTLTDSLPGVPRQMRLLPVTDMQTDASSLQSIYNLRNLPPPPWMQKTVQDAAQTGSREVFDTSMISGLLQSTQGDLQVDRFLGPLMKGLDAIGRILVNLYWHDKDFAERYGKNDMVGLEDMLRNTFLNTGKLILNLKRKATEDPFDTQRELDPASDSDQ